MIAAATAFLSRVPPRFWRILAAVVLVIGLAVAAHQWHAGRVEDAITAAKTEQRDADAAAAREAFDAAQAERARLNAAIAARDTIIKENENEKLAHAQADNARRAADLERLWRARRADPGRPGTADLPGPAGTAAVAADAACTAGGGLSFDLALPALKDAEDDAAKLRAWQAWWAAISAVDRR